MWKEFETACFNYIKSKLPKGYEANLCGGSDPTVSDIAIKRNNAIDFYVEVKESPSQAGQFALVIEDDKFVFSNKNKCREEPCRKIIDYLNKHFEIYKDVAQSAIAVDVDKNIQYKRIIDLYRFEKNVRYFITKKDDFIVFPVEKLSKYFDISCVLRRKKSGSQNVGKQDRDIVTEIIGDYLKQEYPNCVCTFEFVEDYFNVTVTGVPNLSGTRISTTFYDLYFSKSETDTYTITKLSNTNNPNIIFTLELIPKGQKTSNEAIRVLESE